MEPNQESQPERLRLVNSADSTWPGHCPPLNLLKGLIEETLADSLVQATTDHLENCDHCQATIERWLDGGENEQTEGLSIPGYEVGVEVGRGGMGIVYRARRLSTGDVVALKILAPHTLDRPESQGRFQQEVASLHRLNHPGIVKILDSGWIGRQPWFAMEMINGPNLETFLRSRPQPPGDAVDFMLRVLPAVETAHQQRIIHRDLKPTNILLQPIAAENAAPEKTLGSYQPKLVDFGIAKWIANTTELTRTGDFIGSLETMSPEVLLGESRGDERSDVYALGALLYILLVGRSPIRATTIAELVRRIATEPPLPLRRFDPSIPLPLERICLKCLQRRPADRYASVMELRTDMERFRDGQRVMARPLPWPRRLWTWGKQKPAALTAILLGGGSLLLLFALMAWHQWELTQEQRRTEESYRVAVDTTQKTFDEFFRMLGVLGGQGTVFRARGIVDQQIENLLVLEKQRPDDIQVQLMLARLEAARAEEEKNESLAFVNASDKLTSLQKARELISRSLARTEKAKHGDRMIAAMQQHEHACLLASEIHRNLDEPTQSSQWLQEGFATIEQLKEKEPGEWRHDCRYLFALTERSWQLWNSWQSRQMSLESTLDALTQYCDQVEKTVSHLRESKAEGELEVLASSRSVYSDLATWYFVLGTQIDAEHYSKALAYNRRAIESAEREFAFLGSAEGAYRIEQLRMNFCNVLSFDGEPLTSWSDLRESFYQSIQKAPPLEAAGDRFLHLQKAIMYELETVESKLPASCFLSDSQWQRLLDRVEQSYVSLRPKLAERFAGIYSNLKERLEQRLNAARPDGETR